MTMQTAAAAPRNAEMSPRDVRRAIRAGEIDGPTSGFATDFVQANLVALPRADAADFLLFCERNPQPCPLLEVTAPGSPEPKHVAPGADLRTDIPRYRVYQSGELVAELTDIASVWRDDLVSFLLGCSYTFEGPLLEAGVPVRHLTGQSNVPMYRTNRQCEPAGAFSGPLVVSMRSVPAAQVETTITVTGRLPAVHGAPVHVGDPAAIGIEDLSRPEWGDPPLIEPGDVPVFWACGVTPQAVAMASKPDFMITHAPGHMLVTDLTVASLVVSRES